MIERRGQKQQDHATAIEAVTDKSEGVRLPRSGLTDHQYQPDDTEQAAKAVTDTVGNFFSN